MPTYTFRNKKTGEVEEMFISMTDREEILRTGEWEQIITNHSGFISDSKSTLTRAGSEWQNFLTKVKKGAGKRIKNTIHD
jgi:hypothetical protein